MFLSNCKHLSKFWFLKQCYAMEKLSNYPSQIKQIIFGRNFVQKWVVFSRLNDKKVNALTFWRLLTSKGQPDQTLIDMSIARRFSDRLFWKSSTGKLILKWEKNKLNYIKKRKSNTQNFDARSIIKISLLVHAPDTNSYRELVTNASPHKYINVITSLVTLIYINPCHYHGDGCGKFSFSRVIWWRHAWYS